MPSKSEMAALCDIQHHIQLAVKFTSTVDLQAFRDDQRTLYAVTRCLEIISEASRRLSNELKARHPGIQWKHMAGAGNVYRHDYEDVAAHYVWDTVLALPSLLKVVEEELRKRETSS